MKLEKAIETLSKDLTYTYPTQFNDLQDAVKLGIEALQRIKKTRGGLYAGTWKDLPGETTEEDNAV